MFVSGGNATSMGFVDDGISIGGAPRAPRVRAFALSTGVPPAFSRARVSMSALARRSSCCAESFVGVERDRLLELGDGEVELARGPVDAPALVVDLGRLKARPAEGDARARSRSDRGRGPARRRGRRDPSARALPRARASCTARDGRAAGHGEGERERRERPPAPGRRAESAGGSAVSCRRHAMSFDLPLMAAEWECVG